MDIERKIISLVEIEIKDLNENIIIISDLPKVLGNIIFTNAETIEISDIARQLHKGNEAFVTEEEIKEITTILARHSYYKPWVHHQVIRYFTDKITF